MTFTSWQFGIFVGTVFGAYYFPPLKTLQIQLLVIASLFFYGYGQPALLPLLAVAVFGTYLFLILALRQRAIWLPVGIAFNLALLAFFKYKFLFIVAATTPLSDIAAFDFLLRLPLPTQDKCLLVTPYSDQIYADFFGYSSIAVGLGLLFGYRLPVNFNLPYIA